MIEDGSDDIPEWARNCPSRKQKFASAEEAMRIHRQEMRRSSSFKGTPHAYKCPQCDGFHVTTMTHTRKKRKFKRDWREGES